MPEQSHDPVPDPDGDWDAIQRYAMTFNGYQHFGDNWGAAAAALRAQFEIDEQLPGSAEDLRAALWIEFRRDRFTSDDDGAFTFERGDDGILELVANPAWGPQHPTQRYRRALVRQIQTQS